METSLRPDELDARGYGRISSLGRLRRIYPLLPLYAFGGNSCHVYVTDNKVDDINMGLTREFGRKMAILFLRLRFSGRIPLRREGKCV
jgi:hypothetical protein